MKISLWIVQILLAMSYLATGLFKLFDFAQAAAARPWMVGHRGLVDFTAAAEIAGALGLILPGITGLWPKLTAWAAGGLGLMMILATGFHYLRGEYSHMIGTVSLFVLNAFVAWGRAAGRGSRHS